MKVPKTITGVRRVVVTKELAWRHLQIGVQSCKKWATLYGLSSTHLRFQQDLYVQVYIRNESQRNVSRTQFYDLMISKMKENGGLVSEMPKVES